MQINKLDNFFVTYVTNIINPYNAGPIWNSLFNITCLMPKHQSSELSSNTTRSGILQYFLETSNL